MDRFYQSLLMAGTLLFSWLAMMTLHETGHVMHTIACGGAVERVVLPVFGFSRTDVAVNPRPLFVAWGGVVWGSLLPLGLLAVASWWTPRYAFLARFFAGFCLIANGAYLAGGAWLAAGDAADLLRLGAQRWQLLAFGLPAIGVGLALWNGLGPHFGLASRGGRVDRRASIAIAVASGGLAIIDVAVGLMQARM